LEEETPGEQTLTRSSRRSVSLDNSEIAAIIEFDDAIQSLIKEQFLNDSHDIISEESFNDEEPLKEEINPVVNDDENEIDVNYFRRESSSVRDSINIKQSLFELEDEGAITKSLSCSNIYDSIRHNSNDMASNNTQEHSIHVNFGDVEERMYSLILGDHPDCTDGPPTTLSWNYQEMGKTDICSYESQRPFPRREANRLRMSKVTREFLLKEKGFTTYELHDAVKSVRKSVRNRKITNDFSRVDDTRYALGSAARSISKSLKMPLKPILKKI